MSCKGVAHFFSFLVGNGATKVLTTWFLPFNLISKVREGGALLLHALCVSPNLHSILVCNSGISMLISRRTVVGGTKVVAL